MNRVCLVACALLLSLNANSQKGRFALGTVLGNPTGISAKYWTGKITAIDVSLGYYFSGRDHPYLNTDFLFHFWSIEKEEDLVKVYFGAGAGMGFISDLSISIRTPGGAALYLANAPLEIFFEIVPSLQLIGPGNTSFQLGGYIGTRWFL